MSKKSRKLIRQAGGVVPDAAADPALAQVPGDDPYAEYAGRDWGFHFLPPAEPTPVSEKALHGLMKDWRHGRASRTIGQVVGDAYFMIFSLGIIGAMVVNLLLNQQKNAAGCTAESCVAGRALLPWAVLFAVATMTLSIARIFGPVLASAAEGFWLMEAPISRTRLLSSRLVSIVLSAFAVAAVIGALMGLLAGIAPWGIAAWTLGTGATASALMALASVEQSFERRLVLRVVQTLVSLAAAALVVWMVGVSSGRLTLGLATGLGFAPWVIAAGAGALTVAFAVLGFSRLNQIRRARLLSGGSLVSGMQGAMFALDLGLARDILVERDAVERGHVRPTQGRGLGVQALVWRDAQRLLRFPKPLLGLVAAGLVPYASDALGLGFLMPFLAALALVAAMIPFFGSLRVLSRTGGLARTFPFSTGQLRQATLIVPAVLAALWALCVLPAVYGVIGGYVRPLDDALLVTVAIALAGLLGAMRWVTAKQVDFNTPMMATNAGAMPPGLIFNLFRGIDVAATVTAPLMFGAPPWVALIVAALWYGITSNGKSMEQIQEEAKEAQKELEAEKAARGKGPVEKIRVERPKR